MVLDYRIAAEVFYRELFERMPSLRARFPRPERQRTMFEIAMRVAGSHAIDDPELVGHLNRLGEKHKLMGITSVQMKVGHEAFVAALNALGSDLSEEERARHMAALKKLEQALGF